MTALVTLTMSKNLETLQMYMVAMEGLVQVGLQPQTGWEIIAILLEELQMATLGAQQLHHMAHLGLIAMVIVGQNS